MIKFILLVINIILILGINLYSVSVTVLPFESANPNWVEEYMVDDGMPRVLENVLANTHLFEVSDYDLFISYFASYEIVASYKTLQTNLQIASEFVKETFDSDYLISGEVLNFTLNKGRRDTAEVEFKVNVIDINNLSVIKTFQNKASYSLPANSPVHKSEDALFNESALGRASILAFDKIVNEMIKFFKISSLSGLVTRIEDNRIFINLGKKDNIKVGDKFDIYKIERVLELPSENTNRNNTNANKINTNNVHTNSLNQTFANKSNIPKTYANTNDNAIEEYQHVRSNDNGDVWFTSEMLYRYRFYNTKENFVSSAEVVELYDNYAILENKSDKEIELMMRVRINKK